MSRVLFKPFVVDILPALTGEDSHARTALGWEFQVRTPTRCGPCQVAGTPILDTTVPLVSEWVPRCVGGFGGTCSFCVGTRRILMGDHRVSVGKSEFVRLSLYGRGCTASGERRYALRAPKTADSGVCER